MAWKDPDIATFRALWKKRAATRGQPTIPEQRATFDADMGAIPLAPGCAVESLDLSGVPAEKISPTGAAAGKVLLYLHGGGHVFGSLKSHRDLGPNYAQYWGIIESCFDLGVTRFEMSKVRLTD